MNRLQWLEFQVAIACVFGISGCVDDGSGQRVLPTTGVDTSQVDYDPIGPEATQHVIRGESLSELTAAPEDLPALREIHAGAEQLFEGKLLAEGLKPGTIRMQFLQRHPKHGEVTAQEGGSSLTREGDFYKYSVHLKSPTVLGKMEAQLQYIEFDVTDPEHPKTTIRVIAKSSVNVLK